ncbi:MAG TPA: class II aldolase/adducin family protein [Pseudomonadales bacterium]|nr:class II aldolase/adducin family protein [Pseudomonadales bacterium]
MKNFLTDPRSPYFNEPESPEEIRAQRKRQVALGYRLFAALRWSDLGDGHITARDPVRTDCFWTLGLGVAYQLATVDDLVLVGPDGKRVEGDGIVSTAVYYIHHPILMARPDLVCAAHAHTGWGTPFSAEVRPIEPITQEACVFFEDHAIFDDEELQILSTEGGDRIAQALGDNRAIILRNHGLLTVGQRVDQAVSTFVRMERVCETHMKVRNAKPISREAALLAKEDLNRIRSDIAGFWFMVGRHIGDDSVVDA